MGNEFWLDCPSKEHELQYHCTKTCMQNGRRPPSSKLKPSGTESIIKGPPREVWDIVHAWLLATGTTVYNPADGWCVAASLLDMQKGCPPSVHDLSAHHPITHSNRTWTSLFISMVAAWLTLSFDSRGAFVDYVWRVFNYHCCILDYLNLDLTFNLYPHSCLKALYIYILTNQH